MAINRGVSSCEAIKSGLVLRTIKTRLTSFESREASSGLSSLLFVFASHTIALCSVLFPKPRCSSTWKCVLSCTWIRPCVCVGRVQYYYYGVMDVLLSGCSCVCSAPKENRYHPDMLFFTGYVFLVNEYQTCFHKSRNRMPDLKQVEGKRN